MTRAIWLLVMAACAEDADPRCLQGVCPNDGETRTLPGPCRAGITGKLVKTPVEFAYDGDRLVRVGLTVLRGYEWDSLRERFEGAEWTYDAAGEVATIVQYEPDPEGRMREPTIWTFGETIVRRVGALYDETYDRAMFTMLMPAVGTLAIAPKPGLGLIESRHSTWAWTVDGNLRIRRATPKSTIAEPGSPIVKYELDEQGRIVSIAGHPSEASNPTYVDRIMYDGSRLVSIDRNTSPITIPADLAWSYDDGGNVSTGLSWSNRAYREVYSYDCW